jgi:nucleotide-binding universal stress UspA family protein
MPGLAKILAPVDFSERSTGAVRYARVLAEHFQSEVVLSHALVPLYSDLGGMETTGTMLVDVYRAREEQARREMDSLARAELNGLNVRTTLIYGEPAASIVKLAHQERADLITMPTHGYGPFRQFLLGSTTAKVLHDCECPVWTGVHMEEVSAGAVNLRRMLCAIDLGPHTLRVVEWAAWLAREFGAELTLIHAIVPEPELRDEPETRWRSELSEEAEEEILTLQRDLGVEAEVLLEAGEPAKVVCSAAARLGADVLVIGRGSTSGRFGRLRASAYSIIRQSPCPVASV